MPVKNAGKYLRACIDSIIAQDFLSWELLAVNDHSKDDTAIILNHYVDKDSRIRMLNNNGRGIVDALQTALEQVKGIYITRMDGDDLMPKSKLHLFYQKVRQQQTNDVVITGLVKYFSEDTLGDGYQRYENWLNQNLLSDQPFKERYKECVVPSPAWLTATSNIRALGGFRVLNYPEDYDLCFRFYDMGLHIVTIPEVIHLWRDHQTRASRNDSHYAENTFLPLKCNWLLKEFTNHMFTIIGAGKKAKFVARHFLNNHQEFHWLTNNSKKLKVPIYGKQLVSLARLTEIANPGIMLLMIANIEEQTVLIEWLNELGYVQGKHFYSLC